ncbi:MAG: iron-containing alcohol dehydrogenase, partial [Christensenellaceae bacterium]
VMATDFTNGIAKEACRLIFEYLPRAYALGAHDAEAREKMANASCMAGMAFANAFLGVCHSMAHKLGAYHHLPHGMANSLLINEVIRFNSSEKPTKMGTFPQYAYPQCKARYADVARYVGCTGANDDELVEALIKKIEALQDAVGQPRTIKDAIGAKETEEQFMSSLDEMVENAFDDQCTGANPRYPLMSEIKQMYLNAYYGTHVDV